MFKKLNLRALPRWSFESVSLVSESIRRQKEGEILHLALSFVERKSDIHELERFVLSALALKGEKPENWDVKRLVKALEKIFSLPEAELFFPDEAEVLREAEFAVSERESLRPDRVVVFPERIVVVDFKTYRGKKIPEEYVAQVKRYKEVASRIFEKPALGFILLIHEPKAVEV